MKLTNETKPNMAVTVLDDGGVEGKASRSAPFTILITRKRYKKGLLPSLRHYTLSLSSTINTLILTIQTPA